MNIRLIALLAAGAAILYVSGVDPLERVSAFFNDSKALSNGEYQARIANKMRSEATEQPLANVPDDPELQQELAAARKKLLTDRAEALEKHSNAILRGDVESLKRQTAENARNAGGSN